jgi:phospholipid/cholesterol/gamma-HCH transport system permease protein
MARDAAATIESRLKGASLGLLDYFVLGARAARFAFARPFYWRDTLVQLDRIGVGAIAIVMLTGLFTGMVLALQSSVELMKFGAGAYIGNLVGASMVRELGPVLAALMVAGRSASGIAAELGSMRVTEQIDALQSFGTDPIKKLVTPRILSGLIMLPILTIVTDAVGIFGGLIVSVYTVQVAADVYLSGVWGALAQSGFLFGFFPRDFVTGLGGAEGAFDHADNVFGRGLNGMGIASLHHYTGQRLGSRETNQDTSGAVEHLLGTSVRLLNLRERKRINALSNANIQQHLWIFGQHSGEA